MTDKVTCITGGKRHEPDYKPNQNVIDILQMLIGEAKNGNLHSIAVAGLLTSGKVVRVAELSPIGSAPELLGTIDLVHDQISDHIRKQL